MILNKSKQPADPQQDAAAAPKKGGAAAFAQKNWKWLVPVAIVVLAGGWWLLKPKGAKPANVDTSYTEAVPETSWNLRSSSNDMRATSSVGSPVLSAAVRIQSARPRETWNSSALFAT